MQAAHAVQFTTKKRHAEEALVPGDPSKCRLQHPPQELSVPSITSQHVQAAPAEQTSCPAEPASKSAEAASIKLLFPSCVLKSKAARATSDAQEALDVIRPAQTQQATRLRRLPAHTTTLAPAPDSPLADKIAGAAAVPSRTKQVTSLRQPADSAACAASTTLPDQHTSDSAMTDVVAALSPQACQPSSRIQLPVAGAEAQQDLRQAEQPQLHPVAADAVLPAQTGPEPEPEPAQLQPPAAAALAAAGQTSASADQAAATRDAIPGDPGQAALRAAPNHAEPAPVTSEEAASAHETAAAAAEVVPPVLSGPPPQDSSYYHQTSISDSKSGPPASQTNLHADLATSVKMPLVISKPQLPPPEARRQPDTRRATVPCHSQSALLQITSVHPGGPIIDSQPQPHSTPYSNVQQLSYPGSQNSGAAGNAHSAWHHLQQNPMTAMPQLPWHVRPPAGLFCPSVYGSAPPRPMMVQHDISAQVQQSRAIQAAHMNALSQPARAQQPVPVHSSRQPPIVHRKPNVASGTAGSTRKEPSVTVSAAVATASVI